MHPTVDEIPVRFSTRIVPVRDRAGWTAALDRLPHAIAHTAAYNAALGDTHLFVAEGPHGRAVCPLARRTRGDAIDVFTPYGFSGFVGEGDLEGLTEAWTTFGRSQGWVTGYAMLHPDLAPFDAEPLTDAYVLPLGGDLLARMSSRRRTALRRQDLEIVDDPEANTARFLALYPGHAERVDASDVYRFDRATLDAWCRHEDILLVGARGPSGDVDAVAMFGRGACAEYMLLARTADAAHLTEGLLYAGFLRLQALGHDAVNLGGGIRGHDGVAEFKRRFGADRVPVHAIRTIFDETRYAALCADAHVDPRVPGFFPAYRRAA